MYLLQLKEIAAIQSNNSYASLLAPFALLGRSYATLGLLHRFDIVNKRTDDEKKPVGRDADPSVCPRSRSHVVDCLFMCKSRFICSPNQMRRR